MKSLSAVLAYYFLVTSIITNLKQINLISAYSLTAKYSYQSLRCNTLSAKLAVKYDLVSKI